ncbi:RagB/SusD family nutrient uptake outer membrane protein [Flaviaesturariibacter amylovorans]|uniref:RagB/SusD family nutrient uptake outer membrane protein n=1 Tax=Flaviaesturariibacter amylovorans TaxID=1084520 RepID=A0ABP8GRL4_9BACT
MKKLILISFVFAISSCSKNFLDKHSLTQIAADNFWKSEADALLGINGIYDVLQDRSMYSGSLNGVTGFPMYDNFGDNCFNSYKFEGPGNYMEGNLDPSDGARNLFTPLWVSSYKGIARANVAIENIAKMPASAISEAKKKVLHGQALFLRSLFYMNLAVYYQDVPLILKVQSLEEAYVRKNTYQEVAAQVVRDLKEAADLLPASYPPAQYGYATKGAALGLLARFQLYNKDYQGVLDATASILTLGYVLNSNYAQLFTEAGENSKEILFSVRFFQDNNVTANGELFSATFNGIPKINSQPMPNLVRDYYCTDGKPITTSPLYNAANPKNNRDPRLAASVYFRNDVFLTDINRVFMGNTSTTYGLKKYLRTLNTSAAGVAVFNPGGQDFIVLRYADVLLMRAEALIELNQLGTPVYDLINQVRARVSMPSIQAVEGTNLGQAALRDILRHERRVELALEGLRFFDLKRWGTVQQAFQAAAADNVVNYRNIVYRGLKSSTFPIPQSELDANSNLTQNPAWQ